jgi:hypothetical protein
VRRAANLDLITLLHGKSVSQTEVIAAEKAADDMAVYAAMGENDILRLISSDPSTLEKLKKVLNAGPEEPTYADTTPALPSPDDEE